MPLIKGNTRTMQDGTRMTQYTDTVGPAYVTYTTEAEQEMMIISNKGLKPIVFIVGTTTGTIQPGDSQRIETYFTSFQVKSTSGIQQFEVRMDEVGTVGGGGGGSSEEVEKLDRKVDSLTSELAEKATKEEARLKSQKLELEDMSETTLGAMSGNATFNLLSVPQDQSVTLNKVDSYIKASLKKLEGTTGSNVNLKIDEKSLNKTDHPVLNSAWTTETFVLDRPATATGLLSINAVFARTGNPTLVILDKIGTTAFKVAKRLPLSVGEGVYSIPTDEIVVEGQYIGFINDNVIYSVPKTSHKAYRFKGVLGDTETTFETTSSYDYLFYYQIGGRLGEIQKISERLDLIQSTSLKDFGATGNGITDDTQSIQDALDSIPSTGGEIFVPPGVYKFTRTLYIKPNTYLYGVGDGSKFVLGDGFSLTQESFRPGHVCYPLMAVKNAQNVTVEAIKVEGNQNQFINQRQLGLVFMDSNKCMAKDVIVDYINYFPEQAVTSGTLGYNIATLRSSKIDIIGGSFEFGGYECVGIADGSRDVIVDRVKSGTGWRTSLQIHRDCHDITVRNCQITQNLIYAHSALTVHAYNNEMKNIKIIGNTVKTLLSGHSADNLGGMQLMGPLGNLEIKDNVVETDWFGISAIGYEEVPYSAKVNISGNTIKSAKLAITCNYKYSQFIIANNVVETEDTGVYATGEGSALNLSGNHINSQGRGVSLSTLKSATVNGNHIYSKLVSLRVSNIEKLVLINNPAIDTLRNTGTEQTTDFYGPVNKMIISCNVFSPVSNRGAVVVNTTIDKALISNNIITSGSRGLDLRAGVSNALIMGNDLSGATTSHYDEGTNNQFLNNIVA